MIDWHEEAMTLLLLVVVTIGTFLVLAILAGALALWAVHAGWLGVD